MVDLRGMLHKTTKYPIGFSSWTVVIGLGRQIVYGKGNTDDKPGQDGLVNSGQ